jgi:hypothetical protein
VSLWQGDRYFEGATSSEYSLCALSKYVCLLSDNRSCLLVESIEYVFGNSLLAPSSCSLSIFSGLENPTCCCTFAAISHKMHS